MSIKKFEDFGDRNYQKPAKDRLSYSELVELDKEIEKYKVEKWVDFPVKMKIRHFDEWKWLEDKGAVKNKAIVVKNFKSAIYNSNGTLKESCDCEPILYEQLMEDLKQHHEWKLKKDYGEQKRIEGLEEIAKSMNVDY